MSTHARLQSPAVRDAALATLAAAGHDFFDRCAPHGPILERHLAEARAGGGEITLTRHDVAALVRIRDAWNADRVSRNEVCLSLTDVLRNVLESTAGLVDPRKADGR